MSSRGASGVRAIFFEKNSSRGSSEEVEPILSLSLEALRTTQETY